MINSPPESVVNDNLEFQDKFLHGLSSPLKLRGHQSSSSCHLIHSKSQTSFINHRDTASPTFLKNQAFSTSISNPQLNLYLKESQGRNFQGNYKGEPKTALAPEFEFIRTPSSSPSSSSDADDTALFTSSDVLKYPTNNLGIVVQPPKQSNEREKGEDRYESLKDAKNYTHWSRIPSSRSPSENFNERSRPKVCEHSKVRSKSVTTNATKSSFEAYEDRMLPALKR